MLGLTRSLIIVHLHTSNQAQTANLISTMSSNTSEFSRNRQHPDTGAARLTRQDIKIA